MAENTDTGLKNKELKRFGFSFGSGMVILTAVGLLKSFPTAVMTATSLLSLFHISGSFIYPKVLTPSFKIISSAGKVVSSLLTTVFFSIFYYLIFTPFALGVRMFRKDVIQKQLESRGWIDIPEEEKDSSRITKQY
ncbi:MAG: hypothetical protein JEY91_10310 [Spirochaetaceae bacterium]|nr:hypothetical protein [Spirochaetaceae bacterium]